jgi:hypothetical protein
VGAARPLSKYTWLSEARNAESGKKVKGDNIVDITTQTYRQDGRIIYTERG